ncbi:MAG TPA: MarR family transcriptional regulator [Candidatus Thermoplasmatota archaeon]|nr:MarR family transcriptional regulator [Candidatus Thermoplasmatota archaeon]
MSEADAPPFPAPPPQQPAAPALEDRERDVLSELAREVDAWVTFQGLRRQLGVHQQALARTLRRLEAQGLISHHGKGYQLTQMGYSSLRGVVPRAAAQRPVLPLVQALLPPHLSPGDVAAHLSRRWFGGLRWYGQSEGPGETTLHWMAERARVTVRVSSGSVTLEVEDAPGNDAKTFAAARPVLAALAELYGTGAGLVESSSRSAA